MADDKEKDLKKFNESLRESIDLSNQLTKALRSLPDNIRLSTDQSKQLITGAKEYKLFHEPDHYRSYQPYHLLFVINLWQARPQFQDL